MWGISGCQSNFQYSQYGIFSTEKLTYVCALEIQLITVCSSYWKCFSLLFVATRYFRLCMRLSLMVITLRMSDFHLRYTNMELSLHSYTSSKQAPEKYVNNEVDHITTAQTQNFAHNSHTNLQTKRKFTSTSPWYVCGVEFRNRNWFPVLVTLCPERIPRRERSFKNLFTDVLFKNKI